MPRTASHDDKDARGGVAQRLCMHEGCTAAGSFRAPADPGRLQDYLWFCLEHVRAYNAAWDFYRGRSAEEIEADRRRADIWDRPTWRLGSGPGAAAREALRRARDFAGFEAQDAGGGQQHRQQQSPRSERERALEELELSGPTDFAAIRRRYRELVKRLHPDATGGDRRAEERLKRVTQAYATLKALHA